MGVEIACFVFYFVQYFDQRFNLLVVRQFRLIDVTNYLNRREYSLYTSLYNRTQLHYEWFLGAEKLDWSALVEYCFCILYASCPHTDVL